jgi:HEPN domain-containing protein
VPAHVGAALTRLSPYYIPPPYPDGWAGGTPADHYGPDDSSSALHDAQQVLTTVRSVWEQLQTAAEDGQVGDAD